MPTRLRDKRYPLSSIHNLRFSLLGSGSFLLCPLFPFILTIASFTAIVSASRMMQWRSIDARRDGDAPGSFSRANGDAALLMCYAQIGRHVRAARGLLLFSQQPLDPGRPS